MIYLVRELPPFRRPTLSFQEELSIPYKDQYGLMFSEVDVSPNLPVNLVRQAPSFDTTPDRDLHSQVPTAHP